MVDIPSAICYIAIEHDPFIVSFPMKTCGSFHSYVYKRLPESKVWYIDREETTNQMDVHFSLVCPICMSMCPLFLT